MTSVVANDVSLQLSMTSKQVLQLLHAEGAGAQGDGSSVDATEACARVTRATVGVTAAGTSVTLLLHQVRTDDVP